MISKKELNPRNFPTTSDIEQNLSILHERINRIRAAYGKPMIVRSGLRSQSLQEKLIKDGKSTAKKSKHLTGQAVDIVDSNGELMNWLLNNMDLLSEVGIWLEDFRWTPTWVHMQIVPPLSKKRIYIPSPTAPLAIDRWDGKYDRKYDT